MAMRAHEFLIERQNLEAYSRYESRGQTFYITHRGFSGGGILCEAYVKGQTIFAQAREKIGHTLVTPEGPQISGGNGVNVVPYKSSVEPLYQRYGVYTAMLDHLEANGFIVYPANGEIGDSALQAQSAEAKAFWAARKKRSSEVKLVPVSKDEFHGWGEYDPSADPTHIGNMPILHKEGTSYPFMVLWQKEYGDTIQQIGIEKINGRTGRVLRLGVTIEFRTGSDAGGYYEDFPLVYSAEREISYFHHNPRLRAKMKATTDKAFRAIYVKLSEMGYQG